MAVLLLLLQCADTGSHQNWLHNHGQHLNKLRLHSSKGLSALPCPQLQLLSLDSCEFNLTSSSNGWWPGSSNDFWRSISTATALTSLHINKCTLLCNSWVGRTRGRGAASAHPPAAPAHFLPTLAPLCRLQEFSLCAVSAASKNALNQPVPLARVLLHATILQRMQHLTQLHMQAGGRAVKLLQHIGSMTDLQDLRLGGVEGAPLQLAVTRLTALTMLQRLGMRRVSLDHGHQQSPQQMLLRCWPGCLACRG